jgi:hypothetical protein
MTRTERRLFEGVMSIDITLLSHAGSRQNREEI